MDKDINLSRERMLDAAESLFIQSGFSAIKLKHIAERLGMKESSIYYHFPEGKEELFIAVMHRTVNRHRKGIEEAIRTANSHWIAQLRAVCHWLISQPAMDIMRLNNSDLPAIDPASALEIEGALYEAINVPICRILEEAVQSGEALVHDTNLIAGMFISLASTVQLIKPAWNPRPKEEMVDVLFYSWITGLRRK